MTQVGRKSPTRLAIGDVVQITWFDTHSHERMRRHEVQEMAEPLPTICWGIVVRKTERYLFIANEIGDPESDGDYIEALPYALIEDCLVLNHLEVKLRPE